MFNKSASRKEFEQKRAELEVADRQVLAMKKRRAELDQSIELSRSRLDVKTAELDALIASSASLADAEQQTRRFADERGKEEVWLAQQVRMRTALDEQIIAAMAVSWRTEIAARAAQRDASAEVYQAAEDEFIKLVREPLRKLIAKAALAQSHAAIVAQGDNALRVGVNAERLWIGSLAERINALSVEPDFYDNLGGIDSGAAPAEPVRSAIFASNERGELRAAGGNVERTLRNLVAPKPKQPEAVDSRYDASFEHRKWALQVLALEEQLKSARERPQMFRSEAAQQRAIEDLSERLANARKFADNWSRNLRQKAA
jgi:hypothetical protein